MLHQELDSFFWKFKNLLFAEKDATITFKSEAGRASVSISVDLGHVQSAQDQLHPHGLRNGPARQRCQEKRANAQGENASAENIKAKVIKATETVENAPNATKQPDAEEAKEF